MLTDIYNSKIMVHKYLMNRGLVYRCTKGNEMHGIAEVTQKLKLLEHGTSILDKLFERDQRQWFIVLTKCSAVSCRVSGRCMHCSR